MSEKINERLERIESALEKLTMMFNEEKEKRDGDLGDDGLPDPPPILIDSRLTRVQSEKVEDILNTFDFAKVQKVMNLLEWCWFDKKMPPSVDELKAQAKKLLIEACVDETNIATGGFRVAYEKPNDIDPEPYICLEFILEECEGFTEENR